MGKIITEQIEKIIAEEIEKNFSEYKQEIIFICIASYILVFIIQFYYNFNLSRKIEKFKGELKKNEIKFSRLNELQIECLKNVYDKVVNFNFAFNSLIDPFYYSHESYKSNISKFINIYNDNMEYFHRNKILLTDELIIQISDLEHKMKRVIDKFMEDYNSLESLEEYHESIDSQVIYRNPDEEVKFIKNKLNKIKLTEEVLNFRNEISILREKIENYFKILVK